MWTTTNEKLSLIFCKSRIDGNMAENIKLHIDVCFKIEVSVKYKKIKVPTLVIHNHWNVNMGVLCFDESGYNINSRRIL